MRKATLPLPLPLAAPWRPEPTIPPGVGCLAAAARPGPPLAVGGHLSRGAPSSFLPPVHSHLPCVRSVVSMLLFSRLLLLTPALRPACARCGAIRETTLPPCSPSLLPVPGPALSPVCSFSLVPPCPPTQAPASLAPCPAVSVSPLPPRRTLRGAIRVASLPLSLLLSAPWCPGPWSCGTHVAPARHTAPACGLFPSTPALSPPSSPCPLPTLTLRRTLCWQVARIPQARTWPPSSAPSGWLAPRCGRPALPQPSQEPPLRAAAPNAAGGAALVGPGCPPARVSLYPPRRLVAGGDPSQNPVRNRKKIDTQKVYVCVCVCTY